MARKPRVPPKGGRTGTRQRLITEGIELLEQVGEQNFSVRHLAREVLEISETAPFQHFRTGDELLLAMAQEGFARLADDIVNSVAKARTPRTRLIAAAAAYIDFSIRHPRLYQLMFSPRFGLYERNPDAEPGLQTAWLKRDAEPKLQRVKEQIWQRLASSLDVGGTDLTAGKEAHPYVLSAGVREFWQANTPGTWSWRSISGQLQYAEAHRAFIAPIYELFRSQMLELSESRNIDDRTLTVTLILHGLASQLAGGWIRRREDETGRDLVERYVTPLLT